MSANRAPQASRSSKLRLAVSASALAALALTGTVASAGIASATPATSAAPAGLQSGTSRSAAREAATSSARSQHLSASDRAGASRADRRGASPRQIAWRMLRHFHWSTRQFRPLNRLWERESGWNVRALNPYSGAAGIPQAVPGSKMASAGPHWRTDARTQIRWGLRYIRARYGSPRRAWEHEASVGWY